MSRSLLTYWLASALLLVAFLVPRPASAQLVLTTDANGLVRRNAQLSNGQTLHVDTTGCTGVTDTVIYVLEVGSTSRRLITRGYNDDYTGRGWCSHVSFTNTSGTVKSYQVIVAAYSRAGVGTVTLSIDSAGYIASESVLVGGARHHDTPWLSGDSFNTKPSTYGALTGGLEDTVLYVINTTPGSESYWDDDGGIYTFSQLQTTSSCSTSMTCHVVLGGYSAATPGTATALRDQTTRGGHDADNDRVADEIEAAFGLSASNADTDSDGIDDYIEMYGVTVPDSSGIESALVMPFRGAEPTRQDLFIEVDYMDQPTAIGSVPAHSHRPGPDLDSDLRSTFEWSGGWTGRPAIRVHLEISQALDHVDGIGLRSCQGGVPSRLDFFTIKSNPFYFDPRRRLIYHYVIAAHQHFVDRTTCALLGSGGYAEVEGNDLIISLGQRELPGAIPAAELRDRQHGAYVHELGHNFWLPDTHSGNGDEEANSCAHSSVMNYRYDMSGWGDPNLLQRGQRFSYSRGLCDATDLDLGGTCDTPCNAMHCVPGGQPSPKSTCPNGISNGTCDCDPNEWSRINIKIKEAAHSWN